MNPYSPPQSTIWDFVYYYTREDKRQMLNATVAFCCSLLTFLLILILISEVENGIHSGSFSSVLGEEDAITLLRLIFLFYCTLFLLLTTCEIIAFVRPLMYHYVSKTLTDKILSSAFTVNLIFIFPALLLLGTYFLSQGLIL